MGDPIPDLQTHRVVRIEDKDIEDAVRLERLLQPLYLMSEPVIDLSSLDELAAGVALRLEHLNRYHTSKGSERLRVVTSCPKIRRMLGGTSNVFRFYDTVKEAAAAGGD